MLRPSATRRRRSRDAISILGESTRMIGLVSGRFRRIPSIASTDGSANPGRPTATTVEIAITKAGSLQEGRSTRLSPPIRKKRSSSGLDWRIASRVRYVYAVPGSSPQFPRHQNPGGLQPQSGPFRSYRRLEYAPLVCAAAVPQQQTRRHPAQVPPDRIRPGSDGQDGPGRMYHRRGRVASSGLGG